MKSIERAIFFKATPVIFERAKILRQNMTEPEKALWERLRNSQIDGYRFRRQHPINKFIADFYCPKAMLIIELDGNIHKTTAVSERDEGREEELKRFGVRVLRFTNEEVLTNLENVISHIKLVLSETV